MKVFMRTMLVHGGGRRRWRGVHAQEGWCRQGAPVSSHTLCPEQLLRAWCLDA